MKVLIISARRSLESARVLLDTGDPAGAASRLYFALFDAMRAAISHQTGLDPRDIKTHHGMFRLFEQHVIAAGFIDPTQARIVYRSQELRLSADYAVPTGVAATDVADVLGQATMFVNRCAEIIGADEADE